MKQLSIAGKPLEDFHICAFFSSKDEVNEVLSRNRQPAVCVYDIEKLTGAMMMDLLRTHPLTLIGGGVQDNPFYIHPAAALEELRTCANSVPESREETTGLPQAL